MKLSATSSLTSSSLKPGVLTDTEMEFIRHPTLGHRILSRGKGMPDIVLDICLHHHERTDGKGYPIGLDDPKTASVPKWRRSVMSTTLWRQYDHIGKPGLPHKRRRGCLIQRAPLTENYCVNSSAELFKHVGRPGPFIRRAKFRRWSQTNEPCAPCKQAYITRAAANQVPPCYVPRYMPQQHMRQFRRSKSGVRLSPVRNGHICLNSSVWFWRLEG